MSDRSEITGIQLLRGFAAIVVVIDHVAAMAAFPKYFGRHLLDGLLSTGALGVDTFFVISGFIIVVVSLQGPQLAPRTSLRSFFQKRFLRIIPLMWIGIAVYMLMRGLFTHTPIEPGPYARAALLLPWGTVEPNTIWTLRHEIIFYGLFALCYLGPWRQLRVLVLAWIFSPLALGLWRGAMGDKVNTEAFIDIVASPVNLEFGAGFFLALLWLKRGWSSDWRLPKGTMVPLLFALGIAGFMLWRWTGLTWKSPESSLALAAINGALIWLACRLWVDSGWISTFGRFLGNASYSIYLFHLGLCSGGLMVASRLVPNLPLPLVVIGVSGGAIAGCCLLHVVLEKPLIALLQRGMMRAGLSNRQAG